MMGDEIGNQTHFLVLPIPQSYEACLQQCHLLRCYLHNCGFKGNGLPTFGEFCKVNREIYIGRLNLKFSKKILTCFDGLFFRASVSKFQFFFVISVWPLLNCQSVQNRYGASIVHGLVEVVEPWPEMLGWLPALPP